MWGQNPLIHGLTPYALKRQHEKAIEDFKESLAIAKNNDDQSKKFPKYEVIS